MVLRHFFWAVSLPFTLLMAPPATFGQGTNVLLSKSRLPSVERKQALGVWLTNSPSPLYYDQQNIKQAVDELEQAGFSVLYPNVWSRGTTFHTSEFAPIEPALKSAGVTVDPICTLSKEAHKRGMKVVPWFEYGLMEPASAKVVQNNPNWVLSRANGDPVMKMHGKEMVWLNPAHPQVRERLLVSWLRS